MSLLYGYKKVQSEKAKIKTYETVITISNYGTPKTVNTFENGVVLLGIVTKGNRGDKNLKVNYDFYDITGNKHISTIQGGGYKLIKNIGSITNIPSCHTCLNPNSISINLMGETTKENKPSKPIKLSVIIQYVELK